MRTTSIPLSQLFVSSLNVRKALDAGEEDTGLDELAASIREKGLLSPPTVRPCVDGRYEFLVGQRRYMACKLIQLDPVPCVVREGLSDAEAISLSLIENVHRADIHPIDKARAFEALHARYGSYEKIAKEASCSIATIRKYLKLLELPPVLQERIGTVDGPAGISALSRLATTFKGDEAVAAFNEIRGFNQRVQEEILKRSGGDFNRLPSLVEEAQEGVFDIRRCGGNLGCALIRDMLEDRLSEVEFGALVREAAQDTKIR
jgi:ParB/RepB/Spo0J family partition protein